jgi:hypothetical protein
MPSDRPRILIFALALGALAWAAVSQADTPRTPPQETATADDQADPYGPKHTRQDQPAVLATTGWSSPVSVFKRDGTTPLTISAATAVPRPIAESESAPVTKTTHLPLPARILFGHWRN